MRISGLLSELAMLAESQDFERVSFLASESEGQINIVFRAFVTDNQVTSSEMDEGNDEKGNRATN